MARQLDFFNMLDAQLRHTAQIFPFPAWKMRNAIRIAADQVTATASPRELDRQVGLLRGWLTKLGVTGAGLERSVSLYRTEIVCEVLRRQRGTAGGRRGGAA